MAKPKFMSRIHAELREFERAAPGTRFVRFHEKQQRESPKWVRPLYFGAAAVALVVGVVLMFLPGPAVLFFALAGALIAAESRWVAARLDSGEVTVRRRVATWRRRHARANR